MLCKTRSKQSTEQANPQKDKIGIDKKVVETKQSLPVCTTSTPVKTRGAAAAAEIPRKTVPEESSGALIRSERTQSTRSATAMGKSSETQSETEMEDASLVTPMVIDKTQASISQRMDDSADTGEYVDELPEDREQRSE